MHEKKKLIGFDAWLFQSYYPKKPFKITRNKVLKLTPVATKHALVVFTWRNVNHSHGDKKKNIDKGSDRENVLVPIFSEQLVSYRPQNNIRTLIMNNNDVLNAGNLFSDSYLCL